jgi:hypothetical protein
LKVASHISPVPHAMADLTTELTVGYPHSPITVGHAPRAAKIRAGQHFPYLGDTDVQRQVSHAFDAAHTAFTIAAAQYAPAPGTVGRQVLITDSDIPAEGYDVVIADPKQVAAHRLGLNSGGRVVVRPDGYIGAVTDLDNLRTVDEYFAVIAR